MQVRCVCGTNYSVVGKVPASKVRCVCGRVGEVQKVPDSSTCLTCSTSYSVGASKCPGCGQELFTRKVGENGKAPWKPKKKKDA